MNTKISELPSADNLQGDEVLPLVQGPDTVKATTLSVANFIAGNPAGMTPFTSLYFGGCQFDPNNDESICLNVASTTAAALVFQCASEGGPVAVGLFGARPYSGLFAYSCDSNYPLALENCNGITINGAQVLSSVGNLVDDASNVVFNRAAGRQAAIANATSTADVVARVNNILTALRNLQLIA